MNQFNFESDRLQSLYSKLGINISGSKGPVMLALFFVGICWLPLAAYTLLKGTFWTGHIQSSFITHFDTQVRFLIALPILILAQRKVSQQLGKILNQFIESEVIEKAALPAFHIIIENNINFIRSRLADVIILLICYLQVFLVLSYQVNSESLFSWQRVEENGTFGFNFAGLWSIWISKPFMLFILYRWIFIILIWGNILRKVSKLPLKFYAIHPDRLGGLGFLGFSLQFFSPFAFAISAMLAALYADYILYANMHVTDLKITFIVFFVFITLLFSLPMMAFSRPLTRAREVAIFKYYNLAAGMNRELIHRISEKNFQVVQDDLDTSHYSTVNDFNALLFNAVQMKSIPFNLKDLMPLWIATIIPFLPVILIEIPLVEVLKKLSGLLM